MTDYYNQLQKDLQLIVKQIPLQWGKVQNNATDSKLDIFSIDSWQNLQIATATLNHYDKMYCIRRWFTWQCSKVDEYLFCLNENVNPNTLKKDKWFDISFCGQEEFKFDIKGTLIPKAFRNNPEEVINNPQVLINFFYEHQSKGVRYGLQNRLFIVHHSFKHWERELMLRCHFEFKKQVYKEYAEQVKSNSVFHTYNTALADIIFIIEQADGRFENKWFSK
jgi:hypothetical protein